MFETIINALEWAKLGVGVLLLIIGLLLLLDRVWQQTKLTFKGYNMKIAFWWVHLGTTLIGLLFILVGFYIADW